MSTVNKTNLSLSQYMGMTVTPGRIKSAIFYLTIYLRIFICREYIVSIKIHWQVSKAQNFISDQKKYLELEFGLQDFFGGGRMEE